MKLIMYRASRKTKTLKSLIEQGRKDDIASSVYCRLRGPIRIGQKKIELYDRINIDSSIVFMADANSSIPVINPVKKRIASLLTKMPSSSLKRLGQDILSAYLVNE